jgi:phage terminase large subunit GpA-like protein
MRDIMDALSPSHPARRVVFMKAAQVGATEAGTNWVGYCIHQAPGPFLGVQPTTDLAKRFSQQRVDPLIDECPQLRDLIMPARTRDSGNTVLSKRFTGGQLILTGANSAVGLRSMPARWLFLDEVDAYPGDVDEEGDPIALAEARTRTFGHRRKIFVVSTPTVKGLSRIEREYEVTDQRRYFLPCPFCQAMQWLKFERLRWEEGRPETAQYVCESCDTPIAEHFKTEMLAGGEWRATAESSDPYVVGFHISGLYSPVGWLSWSQIAREWTAAKGNESALKAAKNTLLGETWQERGEAPEWQRLYDRREDFYMGKVPRGGLILTAGVDVQGDRVEIDVWAWGRGLESWLVEHFVVEGSPQLTSTWDRVAVILTQAFPREGGGPPMTISRSAVDSGDGQSTAKVYEFTRKVGSSIAMAIKGVDGFDRSSPVDGPIYVDAKESGKKIRKGAKLWRVSVAVFKSELYRFLRQEAPTDEDLAQGVVHPDGFVHLPKGATAEWVKQLVAEQLVTVIDKRRFSKLEWRKLRDRNEALDLRVYARAALWVLGADRYGAAFWTRLDQGPLKQTMVAPGEPGPETPQPKPPAPKPPSGPTQTFLGGRQKGWLR